MARIGGADAITGVPTYKPPRQSLGSGGGYYQPTNPSPAAKIGLGLSGGASSSSGGGPQTVTTIMTPNQVYQGEILSDPGSVAALGTFNAQTNQLATARADAIQRAIINSGYSPEMKDGLA